MICPYCGKEMEKGWVEQDIRHGLRWTPEKRDDAFFSFKDKSIKLSSLWKGGAVKMYHCENCRKFIIDQDEIEA